jgi:hypothetical protein
VAGERHRHVGQRRPILAGHPGDSDRDGSTDKRQPADLAPGVSDQADRRPDAWISGSIPRRSCFPASASAARRAQYLEGPGHGDRRSAIVKNTAALRQRSVQLRLEIFNLLNRANFDIPFNDPTAKRSSTTPGARIPTAGKIFATSTDAREMQIAVRFVF